MKNLAQHIVTQKLKQLTVKDVLKYSKMYNVTISEREAQQIIHELSRNSYNPFNTDERMIMLKKLAQITSPKTASNVNRILHRVAKEHGVGHLLN
ncbi:DUF2624 domain-containing protein [Thalassobacillus pellis]|uniref:DUF2624 domain-containing protein n=1 Tax=Thalassobacillus pellis TaxID=748008 RepID=UPI001961F7DA|nr:DUF2624 domain-containing protein [Thalassobacillus pellis]MBM7554748.1 hypothetical protein [Thalassobacillus pellis]